MAGKEVTIQPDLGGFYTDARVLPIPESQRRLADLPWIKVECSYGPGVIDRVKYRQYLEQSGFSPDQVEVFSRMTTINFSSATHNPMFSDEISESLGQVDKGVLDTYREIISIYHQSGSLKSRIVFCRDGTSPTTVFQEAAKADYFFIPDELGSGTQPAALEAVKSPQLIPLSHRDASGQPLDYLGQVAAAYHRLKLKDPAVRFALQVGAPSKTGLVPKGLSAFLEAVASRDNFFTLIDAVQWRDIAPVWWQSVINHLVEKGKVSLVGSFSKFAGGAPFSGYLILSENLLAGIDDSDVVSDEAFLTRLSQSQEKIFRAFSLAAETRRAVEGQLAELVRQKWQEYLGALLPLDSANQTTNTIFCFRPNRLLTELTRRVGGQVTAEQVKELGRRYIDFMAAPFLGSSDLTDRLTFIPAMPVGNLWRFALNADQVLLASTDQGMAKMKTIIDAFIKKHRHLKTDGVKLLLA